MAIASEGRKVLAAVVLAGLVPVLTSLLVSFFFGAAPHVQEALHEFLELTGACIGLVVVLLLSLRAQHEEVPPHLLCCSAALVAMGLLDGVHSVVPWDVVPGWGWFRHGATLVGGCVFGLVWVPLPPATIERSHRSFVGAALGLSLGIALLIFLRPDLMPNTWSGESYTWAMKAANMLGGLGFLAAAIFFFRRYLRRPHAEDLVFGSHTLLFGMASVLFGFSTMWGADWWVWHGFRLAAYTILLATCAEVIVSLYRRLARDIIERESLVAALQVRNTEMERFVYTISHELKTPLVTANCYLGLLKDHLDEGNAEAVSGDMARIGRATTHMHQLLGELLELSRIGRVVEPSTSMPFAVPAREAVELVSARIAERNFEILIAADLPTVYGDRARLLQVMENLLTNAIKFMGDQARPRIEIGARRDGDETVFFVRDNGIGIDPRYLGRVFRLFERLEPSIEGTGAGLTIVKQIVELHGGRIWVESAGRGKGATFCFTLAGGPQASVSSAEPSKSSSGATA